WTSISSFWDTKSRTVRSALVWNSARKPKGRGANISTLAADVPSCHRSSLSHADAEALAITRGLANLNLGVSANALRAGAPSRENVTALASRRVSSSEALCASERCPGTSNAKVTTTVVARSIGSCIRPIDLVSAFPRDARLLREAMADLGMALHGPGSATRPLGPSL